ncbi:hypothetical protein ACFXPS_31710 [Nocardia sp. NPDC059091]|uniref:hypothetical protein n=1 Tax=unclassified Nocardia TaxID=2637762 RepID=UPI00367CA210
MQGLEPVEAIQLKVDVGLQSREPGRQAALAEVVVFTGDGEFLVHHQQASVTGVSVATSALICALTLAGSH